MLALGVPEHHVAAVLNGASPAGTAAPEAGKDKLKGHKGLRAPQQGSKRWQSQLVLTPEIQVNLHCVSHPAQLSDWQS